MFNARNAIERAKTTDEQEKVMKRTRYNRQNGLYSRDTQGHLDLEAYPMREDSFQWEINLQDVFPSQRRNEGEGRRQDVSAAEYHNEDQRHDDDDENNNLNNDDDDNTSETFEEELLVIQHRIHEQQAWKSALGSSSSSLSIGL